VFPKIFLLHKVVRDAKKVEKHWPSLHNTHIADATQLSTTKQSSIAYQQFKSSLLLPPRRKIFTMK